MTNPTSNFGWQMPTATDLVTDLPADFEVFGQAVDTSMADLKGGTTGQILSKATNADMDFVWTSANPGDITAVNTTAPLQGGATSGAVTLSVDAATTAAAGVVQLTNSVSSTSITTAAVPANVKTAYDLAAAAVPLSTVTTNGDLIYGTGASTVTRRAIGTTGQVLTVSGGVPTWATPSSGGMDVIASGNLTGSSITISSIPQTYKNLQLIFRNPLMTTGQAISVRFNGDTGTNYYNTSTNPINLQSWNTTWVRPSNSQDTTTSQGFTVVNINDYANTSTWKTIASQSINNRTGDPTKFDVAVIWSYWYASNGASAITSMELRTDTSGWTSGTYILYGVK